MFETAELGRTVSKDVYAEREAALRVDLLALQTQLREEASFPLVVLINGVDGAGKGETVNLLHEWMDPRFVRAKAFGPPTDEELARPAYWRYWRALPPKGHTSIFFGNWYTPTIVGRAIGSMKKGDFLREVQRIRQFEEALVDDGALIVKLWFHLSKKAQAHVYDKLQAKKSTRWRVTPEDLERHKRYDCFRTVSEVVVRETSTGACPWHLIEAADRRYRELTVAETLIKTLRRRFAATTAAAPSTTSLSVSLSTPSSLAKAPQKAPRVPTILDTIDLTTRIKKSTYEKRLGGLQHALHEAVEGLRKRNQAAVLVFEGQDAAGKGGAIRQVTSALDARDYQVIPVAAPTDEERAQHYLWRFWRHLPAQGKVAIYDRSWYGRVLVERVEGFATEPAWRRAYREINEFEEELKDGGIVVVKFWLQIDAEEQMERFKARESTAFKRFKITPDDWRNREKWPAYETAVHEMIEKTSTGVAPWHLIGANDKYSARLQVLDAAVDAINASIKLPPRR